MKARKTYRFPAATLVELLVAMSLISAVFVIGSQIYLQLNGVRAPFREQEQRLQARHLIQQASRGEKIPERIETGAITYFTLSQSLPGHPDLVQIEVRCEGPGEEVLFTRKKIIAPPLASP